MKRMALMLVSLAACTSACASATQSATSSVTRLAPRDQPALAIKGDTARCAGDQWVDVKNPSPRQVTVAARTPTGLARLSSDNLLQPFEKRRFVFPASVQLTGFAAWAFDSALGIGRNAENMVDVEPKRSCAPPK